MPSIERPNAPTRLPSIVFNNTRFHQRASPTSSEALSSASVSPTTQSAQRKSSKASPGHRRFFSESQESPKTLQLHESAGSSSALDFVIPTKKRGSIRSGQRSRTASLSQPTSARSSISTRARQLLNIPPLRVASTATKDGAPPRQPKHGFHWQHEISGHWMEIRVGKKQSAPTPLAPALPAPFLLSPATESGGSISAYETAAALVMKPSTKASTPARDTGRRTPDKASRVSSSVSSTLSITGLLFEKAKRKLKSPISRNETSTQTDRTKTGEMLERTSSRLRVIATNRSQLLASPKVSPSLSNSSSPDSSNHSSHVPKWHPIVNDFIKRSHSSTSSSRSNIQEKPPTNTPEPHELYFAADQQRYFRVEMTDDDGPNFLPSEAKRINTPPVGGRSKHRGWFFDHRPPRTGNSLPPEHFQRRRATVGKQDEEAKPNKTARDCTTDWYDVQLGAIEAEFLLRQNFVEEVPDHLPNSPLCPRHPKHQSGGLGTCPVHGRTERDDIDVNSGEAHKTPQAPEVEEYKIEY